MIGELKYKGLGGDLKTDDTTTPMKLVHWFFKISLLGCVMSFGESSNRPIYPLTLSHTQQGCLERPFCFVIEKLKINKTVQMNNKPAALTSTPCRMEDDVWARNTFLFNSCPILKPWWLVQLCININNSHPSTYLEATKCILPT